MFGRTALLRTVRRAPVSGLTRSSARSLSVRAQPNGSSGGSGNAGSGSWSPFGFAAAATAGAAAFAFVSLDRDELIASARAPVDYVAIRKEIAAVLENDDYDDGSYGPVLIRLAWHTSGTYDRVTGKGGSNGSRMRFDEEGSWGANAGLKVARDLLEPIKERHPEISYGDLWTLAGCVAIEEMGGPKIQWRPGRADAPSAAGGPPDGTLPDASQGADHVRDIFYRMGFSDREIVALVGGGHALGRCHTDRSGYEGPWSFSPTTFSNEYFRLLLESKWQVRPDFSPEQYEDAETKTLMMLPADMVMLTDKAFLVYTKLYAKDSDLFFRDFARAWEKLISLGVPGQ